jgi:hypothetical protein
LSTIDHVAAPAPDLKTVLEEEMSALAVLLDELVGRGGEVQIKRTRARFGFGFGSTWELTLWSPTPGSDYPHIDARIHATTSLDLLRQLETYLELKQEREQALVALGRRPAVQSTTA